MPHDGSGIPPTGAPPSPPENAKQIARGQAALMLVENLMHSLVHHNVMTREVAIDTVDTVTDTKNEMAGASEPAEIANAAAGMLRTISNSLAAAPPPVANGNKRARKTGKVPPS